jgi:MFS transporter, LPLT family, lysophospholipid transporter
MKKGFYTIMAAQFFSSLADNALLIAAIALLENRYAPPWMTPLLKLFFVLSYVVLAAFVGAFADAMPKGRVMFITNMTKIFGCAMMFVGVHPLLAYGIVGFGAAAYSPAKYGILTELLPPTRLVVANGWIESTTVSSIILGIALGSVLVDPALMQHLLKLNLPGIETAMQAAIVVIAGIYILAALFNIGIPDTGARYPKQQHTPEKLVIDFAACLTVLWRDKLGQISLATTTLFWGVGTALQFIILQWAHTSLGMSLSAGALLLVIFSIGIAGGAIIAAVKIPLSCALNVLPLGLLMGGGLMMMAFYTHDLFPLDWGLHIAHMTIPIYQLATWLFLIIMGTVCGFFIVPMNALLQHRGYLLLSAGHSIAVQNFNENLSILVMLCLYAILIWLDVPIALIMMLFGALVCLSVWGVMRLHQENQRRFDSVALIGQEKQ